jgi:UDP-N-acetylglucosamine/UDP-N-acetyl-alpha-D-glucosaminouronate 4-epimerase
LAAEKVLVTGGAGFIGSHLSGELSARGFRPVILDDLSSGKLENINPLLADGRADFVRGSVTDIALVREVTAGVRYVFHLAAIASVPASVADPVASHEVNVSGTLNVLLAARDAGVSKVVLSSSCAVYGDTGAAAVSEDMSAKPMSPYAAGKLAAEHYCRVFSDVYGLPTACLRYFNVYGPRQNPDSDYAAVIPRFLSLVSGGRSPIIYGDGRQTRDFIYVKDVVRANIWVATGDSDGIYNIGSGHPTSVNELAKLVNSVSGADITPVYEPGRAGDIRHSRADISRAAAAGYHSEYSLEAGLGETAQYLRGD